MARSKNEHVEKVSLLLDEKSEEVLCFVVVRQLKLAASEQEKQLTAQPAAKDAGKCMLSP